MAKKLKSFKHFLAMSEKKERLRRARNESLPFLDAVYVTTDGIKYEYLNETRNWVDGRFKKNIGIDQPAHGVGQKHAHVYGRKGKEIVIVNADGTSSHGTKGKLHDQDADALRGRGFDIRTGNVVEWNVVGTTEELLLG